MALWQAKQMLYPGPIQAIMSSDGANDPICIPGDFVIVAGMVGNDIIEMCPIPANYVPVDAQIYNEALGATATSDVGVMSGNAGALLAIDGVSARTCGNEFGTGIALGAAGVQRPTKKDFGLIAPFAPDMTTTPNVTSGDRGVGIKITTFTTPTVGAKVRMNLWCRPKLEGV